jgi:pimeloyl-ACP methyl ester carboxylesterase
MCASWEYEACATHQSWRVLADRLAEAEMPTLRYDYPGCGDSLGDSDTPGAFEAMQKSISAACGALRSRTGVHRVALVGLRLGASMALLAAETLEIEAVALIRPVVRGKSYLAEQRALARLVQARERWRDRRETDPGALEVEGFRLSPESVERIAKIDLVASDRPAPRRVLIAGEPGSIQYEALRDKLVAQSVSITRIDLAEVAGWAPAVAVPVPPPLADCDVIAAWLKGSNNPQTSSPTWGPGPQDATFPEYATTELASPTAEGLGLQDSIFVEAAMTFGPGGALSGILCRPSRVSSKTSAVIFLNTGANSHIGAGRATVFHARSLAARGIASLRMDIFGIGDSSWTKEGPLSAIHHAERSSDVSQAINELRMLHFEEISLVGVCSGAFLAFQTALEDSRVDGILIANPRFWLPLTSNELADPMSGFYDPTPVYVKKFVSLTTWRRAIGGELKLPTMYSIARELGARSARRAFSTMQRAQAKLFPRSIGPGKLVPQLRQLAARGCRMRLLLSEGDPGWEALAALLPGGDLAVLDGLLPIVIAEGADHALVTRRTREEFSRLLCDFLEAGSCINGDPKPVATVGEANFTEAMALPREPLAE